MSGENQQWDAGPVHATKAAHEAPKNPSPEFEENQRAEKIRTVLWLIGIGLGIAGTIAWHHGWRPW